MTNILMPHMPPTVWQHLEFIEGADTITPTRLLISRVQVRPALGQASVKVKPRR